MSGMQNAPREKHPDLQSILITEDQLSARVKELAAEISRDYAGKCPALISVLKGSFIFMADLTRALSIPCHIDFLAVSSYGARSETSGAAQILKDITLNIENRDVCVVEDILDSGVTLRYIMKLLAARNPASIKLCTLLNKPERRQVPVTADYVGFTVPDEFVVGYGLDYAEQYRNLPYVGVLAPRVYLK